MKIVIIIASTLLSLATANPVAAPVQSSPVVADSQCYCSPPICPLELIAECECKNAAAEACFQKYLAVGVQCPKPTPKICGAVAARANVKAVPTLPTGAV
ncbi:hypothetical protein K504DRAFT_536044 [Pleomassaria siparia CBS 279.74]|uniref:Extracellular membrane protein CFEM domain-containing protein n=1 Tax=Pleomassaria siparia CBS 279.74 TaxID=1314801 RepID=A0A6G1K1I8_9PLEO|nr:hypothetical protein K504DRAFT_536044 [Pleomassaria siparia CBS 279.74]